MWGGKRTAITPFSTALTVQLLKFYILRKPMNSSRYSGKLQSSSFLSPTMTGLTEVEKTIAGSSSPAALKKEVLFRNSTDFQESREERDSLTKMFIYWHGNNFSWVTKFPNFLEVKQFEENFIDYQPRVWCKDHWNKKSHLKRLIKQGA